MRGPENLLGRPKLDTTAPIVVSGACLKTEDSDRIHECRTRY